ITGMGDTYSDNLQQNKICQGRKLLGFNREVDRVYTQAEPCIRIHDRLNRRTILVENQNENAAVIWNPWKELSHSMADMKDDSYQTMVCVEAAVHALSLEQGYKLAPGEHYQLSTCISVLNH
ncbi:MAG: D-hexose-6-phosphate mutarotase, partial [Vibrio sp.]